jgi:glycosyltransferase involved in cell wall biosynthesis
VHPADDMAGDVFSVIIPVFDEEAALPRTLRALLRGLPDGAELVFVCNGCTDRSEAILRACPDPRITVLTLAEPGKAGAIRAGERQASVFPRFFVDADVEIEGGDLRRLAVQLFSRDLQLVSPAINFDLNGCSRLARAVNLIWLELPHGRASGFQAVLGFSRAGRAHWGELPDLLADDSFMASQIPAAQRAIVPDVVAQVRPPRNLASLFKVRMRIESGLRQLRQAGVEPPLAPGQRLALIRLLLRPSRTVPALLYLAITLAARAANVFGTRHRAWLRDGSSRQ